MNWKIFNIFKKNKDKMSNIDTLMSLKNSYQGVTFQWVKPLKNIKNTLGAIVTVTDIKTRLLSNRTYAYDAVLSDGITINIDDLNSNLMMIHGEQTPLTSDEIYSINLSTTGLDVVQLKETLPSELHNYSTIDDTRKMIINNESTIEQQIESNMDLLKKNSNSDETADLFGMFTLDDTNLNLTLDIKLPSKNLLKLMFNNSQDQDEFISKLSTYINKNITLDAINSSVRRFIGPAKK